MRSDLPRSNFSYTLCFLTRGDHILMLHRRRPPNQGLWNRVGGRIEAGESPLTACLREVREETGYHFWYSNAQITHHVVEPLPAWAQTV